MNYQTTATEVQQVNKKSLLIQDLENLAPLNEAELQKVGVEELQGVVGSTLGELPQSLLPPTDAEGA